LSRPERVCKETMSIRICASSGEEFAVTPGELAFYERLGVPLPRLCPTERLRRRMAFFNPLTIFSRKSSWGGKALFSMYAENAPFPVIEKDSWWGDRWDALEFGREIDFDRPFLAQMDELSREVPRPSLSLLRVENSDYINHATDVKDSYLVFGCTALEDSLYCARSYCCRDCMDCHGVDHCELCFACIVCDNCYNLQEAFNCQNCSDSLFLRNCRSCEHCFGCTNLYRKQFHIYNKPHSRQDYNAFINVLDLGSYAKRSRLRAEADAFFLKHPQPCANMAQVEEASGNYIYRSSQIHASFLIRQCEHMRYAYGVQNAKHCMDYTQWGDQSELMYECVGCGEGAYNLRFCTVCYDSVSNLEYCRDCVAARDCFGCDGVRGKQYCIFNRQYSQVEYEQLKRRLKEAMLQSGEYGEFFPINASPIPYNASLAQWYFPRSEEQARSDGLYWLEKPVAMGKEVIPAAKLPDAVPSQDQPVVAASELSGKPFRLTAEELRRFRRFGVPLPRRSHEERMLERARAMGEIRLYQRECSKTGNPQLLSPGFPLADLGAGGI
jgi:hypothetical protein